MLTIASGAAPIPPSSAAPPAASPRPVATAGSVQQPASNEITIAARDQPIGAFLRDLFGRAGRPVVPSPDLAGTVNGVFHGTVANIFGQISRAFNLVGYNDGASYYVYGANEVSGETFAVGSAAASRAVRTAQALHLTGGRNRLRVTSDGSLVVSGVPRFVEQIAAIAKGNGGGVGRADGGGFGGLGPALPTSQPLEFRVFYLRYARAEDTIVTAGGRETRIPGLATILQNLVLDQRPGGSAVTPSFGARPVRQSQPRLGGTGLNAVPPDESQAPILSQPLAGVNSGSDVLGGVDGGGGLVAPLSVDVVRIEPSPSLNAVIVRDVPERMAAYDGLIRALDVEPQVVEIEATIIDVDNDKLRQLGINFRVGSGGFGALFGNGDADSDTRLLPNFGQSRRDNVSNITPSALGGTISTIIGGQRQFLARITALERRGAARIVQRPQIVTLANTEAVFDRTQTFYVRVAGRQQVDLFNVTTGTVLRVNPHVFSDHDQTRIRMMINIEDGNIAGGDLTVDGIPSIERSSVATQAMIVDGESLLIGGMTADADSNTITKVPLLGNIPLLGELFKFRQRQRAHTERLFLITPRLVSLTTSRSIPPAVPAGTPAR